MPCRDYYDDHPEAYFKDVTEPAYQKRIAFAESALCAALNYLESEFGKDYIKLLDCKEAGVTVKELTAWHKNHKAQDAIMRAQKAEAERVAKVTAEARRKVNELFSAEERKILGL